MRFSEIARIPVGDFGDKGTLAPMARRPKTKMLPGSDRYSYAVNRKTADFLEIMIFDGDELAAELDLSATQDPLNTWTVETVATDPDYRGRGLGLALYGIALSILKLTLRAGDTQTKHGQAMWLKLNSISGVEVRGIATQRQRDYNPQPGDEIEYETDATITYSYPVTAGSRSMKAARKHRSIYSGTASMIARWSGRESQ